MTELCLDLLFQLHVSTGDICFSRQQHLTHALCFCWQCTHTYSSHVTPPWGLLSSSSSSLLLLLLVSLPSGFTVSSLQPWAGNSAGLNVVREALLKAQGPISLVQMHMVSLKFQATRHVLFKQLWGYPQKEACQLLSVLLVSFSWIHQSHDGQDSTQWLGQPSDVWNILAAIFTRGTTHFSSFYATQNAKRTTLYIIFNE